MHLLKWQQTNIPAAVCIYNVNQTTKEKENHPLILTTFSSFIKDKCMNVYFIQWFTFIFDYFIQFLYYLNPTVQ